MGTDVKVGGQPASNADFIDAVYGSFPLMIALITITTFILLARAFRSLLLPAKAIVLNVLSVAAPGASWCSSGSTATARAIWDIQATGSIPSWMPLMIFAFLFGLSMDYEVFILARMREEYDHRLHRAGNHHRHRPGAARDRRGADPVPDVRRDGVEPGTDLKMFATGLGAGILLDATVIRALIVPAVIALMGRWNWWLTWPARLLRVEPSLPPRVATADGEG